MAQYAQKLCPAKIAHAVSFVRNWALSSTVYLIDLSNIYMVAVRQGLVFI